jgi:hypothetical protein
MMALVQGLEAEEVGRWSGCGGRTALLPADGGRVVGEGVQGAFKDVGGIGKDVTVGNGTGQFEVAIGDGAVRVRV